MPDKIIISPAQSLLILLDHYKEDPEKLAQLKKYYLSGAETDEARANIIRFLQDKKLEQYEISYRPEVIDKDPSRRYFETHLAYETLIEQLQSIDKADLANYYSKLFNLLTSWSQNRYLPFLDGIFKADEPDEESREYAYYIHKINQGGVLTSLRHAESADEQEKMKLLVQCTYLTLLLTIEKDEYGVPLPLDIYGEGIYLDKGKQLREPEEKQDLTRNPNMGIMKGEMPIPQDDIARAHGEISQAVTPYLRPSDQAFYDERSEWVKKNFDQLVHPFSNSISGTMLCHLRVMAFIKRTGVKFDVDKLNKQLTLTIAAMLYMGGGHSIREYTAPIFLPEVRREYQDVPGFAQLSMHSMFYEGNEVSFSKALADSIEYNKMILLKKEMHAQLSDSDQLETKPVAGHLKLIQEINAFPAKLEKKYENYTTKEQEAFFKNSEAEEKFIAEKMLKIKDCLEKVKIVEAKSEASSLKEDISKKFGRKNLIGQIRESYRFVESIEKELEQLMDKTKKQARAMKDSLENLKTKESKTDTEEERLNKPNS